MQLSRIMRLSSLVLVFAVLVSCEKTEEIINPPATRYADEVFPAVTVSTMEYSSQYNLQMDVYQPINDTAQNRPVVVLAHGGGFVTGYRFNPVMVRLATNLAKRGYVAVSFTYRLAPNLVSILDSNVAADVVFKAISDSRAVVRFLRKSVAEDGNPYAIDPNKIFMGGNSAGAVLAVHLGFLDSTDAIEPFFETPMQANGGFEGNSGNAGYSSEVKAIFNMAGGIARTAWIDNNDVPSIHFHGIDDDIVPFNCDNVYSGFTGGADVINLCGSAPIHDQATSVGLETTLNTYPGKHVPWNSVTDGEPFELFDEVEQKVFDFLFDYL